MSQALNFKILEPQGRPESMVNGWWDLEGALAGDLDGDRVAEALEVL